MLKISITIVWAGLNEMQCRFEIPSAFKPPILAHKGAIIRLSTVRAEGGGTKMSKNSPSAYQGGLKG